MSAVAMIMNSAELVNAISWPKYLPSVSRFLISNWWIGSIAAVAFIRALGRARRLSPRCARGVVPDHASRPHHVENTRGEPEQQKHDHSPRRNPEPPVEQPADAGAKQDSSHELGRQPEAAGDRRRIRCRTCSGLTIGSTAGIDLAKPFAETLQPRGERDLVGRGLLAITWLACVVGHAVDTRDVLVRSRQFRRP